MQAEIMNRIAVGTNPSRQRRSVAAQAFPTG